MAEQTVKQLADEVGIPVDRLLGQLGEAGIQADSADHLISDTDKVQLLKHLQAARASAKAEAGAEPRRISLRRKSTSELKLAGGHGRARTVSVEVRKRRTYVKRPQADEGDEQAAEAAQAEAQRLQEAELEQAREAEEQARQQAEAEEAERARREAEEAEAKRKAEEEAEAKRQAEQEAEAQRKAEEEAEAKRQVEQEAEAQRKAEEEAKRKTEDTKAAGGEPAAAVDEGRLEMQATRRRAQENLRRAAANREREKAAGGPPARRQELHLTKDKAPKRGKKKSRGGRGGAVKVEQLHGFEKPTAPVVREVEVPDAITVGELAQRMAVKAPELIKALMKMGVMATINQTLDQDTALLVVEEMGHKARVIAEGNEEEVLLEQAAGEPDEAETLPRPPVVTIMGHVDHGKTSLLDHIRKTRVAAGEAGGITQHIGAYHVDTSRGTVTFLDTPGHAAFTRMRARGAGITDIVILVVAADDGVMPQTKEAIDHARAAQVPVVVAVTKIDKPEADIERVKNELAQYEVIPEEWGGDTQIVGVSAVSGEGVDQLLEAVLLQAELMELKAPRDSAARGVVVESSLEKGRGPVATVLVKAGTLKQGDVVLSGRYFGRVRAMFDESRKSVKSVGPSLPVEILGLSGTPDAGDEVVVVADERKAREIADLRDARLREHRLAKQQAARLDDVFNQMQEGETHVLNLMVKADVQGSVEALAESLQNLSNDEIRINIVARGVGGISESDVDLAMASEAIVIGFNVRADAKAKRRIQETGVDVRYYSVIYNVLEDVKDAASGLLGTEMREQIVGVAEVRDVFKSSKLGAIAGCLVVDGTVRRGLPIRVLRDNVVIYEGELESLRRFKDDVNRVESGTECGIGVKNYNDVRPGDQIECFERIEVQRSL